ncbi:MAG: AGE family epimerase/isomerase, partial [Promicromonosporaceae bacterium]|nr:AGE family epimerase/isomerase [Promicromonosporaceae bacterium]
MVEPVESVVEPVETTEPVVSVAVPPVEPVVEPVETTGWDHLATETHRLLDFGKAAMVPQGGAAYLDAKGQVDGRFGIQTWITARMLHSYSLAVLLGDDDARETAQVALAGLTGILRDVEHGGWYHAVTMDGTPDLAAGKLAYDHAFVMLAASSAVFAGIEALPGTLTAQELLTEACQVYLDRFWDERYGRPVDTWNDDFTVLDDYRGLNSTMHSVEAMLAVADAVPETERGAWLDRAVRAAAFVVELAAKFDGRLPEHFTPDWQPILDLNRDRPDDQFKPYGATPGHGLEWARLLLHLEAALPVFEIFETTGALLPTARIL